MTDAYSKPCQVSKMIRHIKNPGTVKQFIQVFSEIFRDI